MLRLLLRYTFPCREIGTQLGGCREMSVSKDCTLNNTKLLIDTDPGTDDCHALTHLLTLGNVVAITTVFGNSIQPQTARNACRILEMLGMNEIPVYNGAHCSMLADFRIGDDTPQTLCHGSDGMNDAPNIIPLNVVKQPEISMSAIDAIINTVMKNPGEVTLVALGPLTNIAMATRLCPELPKLVKSLYIMGSSSKFGNVTKWAEFNFHCDPLAAHITLQHFCRTCLVHVVPWEPCLENCISFKDYDSLFEETDKSPARTLVEATGMTKWLTKRKSMGQGYCFADQLVSLLLLYPESVIESECYETMNVIFDEKDEKFGLAEYLKSENLDRNEHGLIVYKKFDMKYMVKLYEKSFISCL